jgi:hypothetical protein
MLVICLGSARAVTDTAPAPFPLGLGVPTLSETMASRATRHSGEAMILRVKVTADPTSETIATLMGTRRSSRPITMMKLAALRRPPSLRASQSTSGSTR